MKKRQSRALASARAYYRLAVKADMAGQVSQANAYRKKADSLVANARASREWALRLQKGTLKP